MPEKCHFCDSDVVGVDNKAHVTTVVTDELLCAPLRMVSRRAVCGSCYVHYLEPSHVELVKTSYLAAQVFSVFHALLHDVDGIMSFYTVHLRDRALLHPAGLYGIVQEALEEGRCLIFRFETAEVYLHLTVEGEEITAEIRVDDAGWKRFIYPIRRLEAMIREVPIKLIRVPR